ncbi:hypothetical protein ACJJTC_001005 [Scirpophaga incertulas]
MSLLGSIYRAIKMLFVTFAFIYFNMFVKIRVTAEKIPIGVVFEQNTEEIQNVFKYAMMHHNPNRSRLDFQIYVDIINTADAFKLSRLICNQFARGVVAMLGAVAPDSFDTLHSYSNTFQMPFITPWFPEKVIPPSSGLVDYAVSLRPDYHRAVIDTITYYGWKNVIYIYDSHDGLLRLQQLYQSLQPGKASFHISNVKRVTSSTDVVEYLGSIEKKDRWSNKYVVLDSTTKLAKETLVSHVRNIQLGRRNFHYLLSGLVMDDRWEKDVTEFGAINITGFRVLDFTRKIVRDFIDALNKDSVSAQSALMHDTAQVLVDSIHRLLRKKPDIFRIAQRRNLSRIDCNPKGGSIVPYENGDKISKMIKKTEIEGLTGPIRFDEAGHRRNFSLQVMELTVEGDLMKVATWYDNKGLVAVTPKLRNSNMAGVYERNRTYLVAVIEEPPYFMRDSPVTGERTGEYKGFCVDLADLIAEKLEISYVFMLVKDGKYGKEDPQINGGWDGIVGEVLRKEVDMAIAPLTITLKRETVIDFTKPFLSFNIKRNNNGSKDLNTIFSFLHPLSKEIWLCILGSMFAVSIVLYLVSKFSPYEWRFIAFGESQPSEQSECSPPPKTDFVNEFNFGNSMWFSLGSFMQQGSDITPRSMSGRIVGTVWWFFALIIVSFYTANLTSYLTISRMTEPITSYNKVALCSEDVLEGSISSGSISNTPMPQEPTEEHGWLNYLLVKPPTKIIENTPCEMLVSLTGSGMKDFAIALPKGSKLREGINLALLSLKEEGELQKLVRKWFTRFECNINEQNVEGAELTLNEVAGLFYILLGGLALALIVAICEFCHHSSRESKITNVPLCTTLKAKARMASRGERKTLAQRNPQREQDRLGWNGGAFAGYYSATTQIGQEETSLHSSFTQV